MLKGLNPGESVGSRPDAASDEEAAQTDSGISVGGKPVPPGGCGREGYRKLYAPTKDSVDLLFAFGLSTQAFDRAENDSRVRDVTAKWSACMAEAGYAGVETPYDVVEKLGLTEDKGGARAVAAAVKDVACKREVNLVGVSTGRGRDGLPEPAGGGTRRDARALQEAAGRPVQAGRLDVLTSRPTSGHGARRRAGPPSSGVRPFGAAAATRRR
ncbi:hypothetical protein [Streptomyces sp. NPDC002467]|uniref:hypothetical protein n=1 Tax=Streptomyces sp. NPDC002467 TaxID=3364647 RepID=UPI003696725E